MRVSTIRCGQTEFGAPSIMRLMTDALRRDGIRFRRLRTVCFAGMVLLGIVAIIRADQCLPQPPFFSQPYDDAGCRWKWQVVDTTTMQFYVTVKGFAVVTNVSGAVVSLPGQVAGMAGMPDLARVATVISGRSGWHASVVADPATWRDVSGVQVAPGAGYNPADAGSTGTVYAETRQFSTAVYNSDTFWPEQPVAVLEAWAATTKLVRVECALLQYNPVRRILRYTMSCSGRVVFYPATDGRR